MKKYFVFFSVVVILVTGSLFLSNCNGNKEKEIKIGAILPLTGRLSVIGQGEKKGIELALDSLRHKYPDEKFEIIFEDFASETKNAVTCANKLISVDKVNAIISSTTAAAEAVTPLAKINNVIHFVITPDIEIVKKSDYNFRIYYNYVAEAKVLNSFLANHKANNLSILGMNYSAIVRQVNEEIEPFAATNNISVLSKDFFDPKDKDFRTLIAKVKGISPEYLFISPHVDQAQTLSNQLMEGNIFFNGKISVIGAYTFNWSPSEYLSTLEGMYILTPKYAAQTNETKISDMFQHRFNVLPSFDMTYAFDNLLILGDLLFKTKGDIKYFAESFNKLGIVNGASGAIEFIGGRETKVEVVMTRIVNGKQVVCQ